jgi:hypothetical protein
MENFCSGVGGEMWVGHWVGSSKEYSAWVKCHDASFTKACCDLDETVADPVDTIVAVGTPYYDWMDFGWSGNDLLAAYGHNLAAVMQAGDGDDDLRGSDHADVDYDETLRGEAGDDVLYSYGGHDTLLGGAGDDELRGGTGPDHISGGLGDDALYGETGNDVLCDATGVTGSCASNGGNFFDAGDGSDHVWYEITSTCTTNVAMDTTSTAGTAGAVDNDTCGNDSDWSETVGVDWPIDCEVPSNVIPSFCDGVLN